MVISTGDPCPAGLTDENLHAIFIGYKPRPIFSVRFARAHQPGNPGFVQHRYIAYNRQKRPRTGGTGDKHTFLPIRTDL